MDLNHHPCLTFTCFPRSPPLSRPTCRAAVSLCTVATGHNSRSSTQEASIVSQDDRYLAKAPMVRDDICYSTRCVTPQPLQSIAASEEICSESTPKTSVCTPVTLCSFICYRQRAEIDIKLGCFVLQPWVWNRDKHTHNGVYKVLQYIIENTYRYVVKYSLH